MGLALSDALCVVAALVASYVLRYPGHLVPAREALVIALAPLVWIGVFSTFNLYAPQYVSAPEELRRVIRASGVGIVLLAMGSFWSKSSFSRVWVGAHLGAGPAAGAAVATAVAGVPVADADGRPAGLADPRSSGPRPRRAGLWRSSTPRLGVPAARVCPSLRPVRPANRLPVLGGIAELDRLIREQAADCVFVASTGITEADMSRITQAGTTGGGRGPGARQPAADAHLAAGVLKVGPAIAVALRPVRLSGPPDLP